MKRDMLNRPNPQWWPPHRMRAWWYWTSAALAGVTLGLLFLLIVWLFP